ncbi:MAG TPA: phosphoribosyltransferase family protein [Nitrososphaeraceae archaeon]|jgi:predicted phosphoribosyltransferase
MFESILNKFQLKFKNREWAANVLAESLKDILKNEKINSKDISIFGIPRGGVITGDVVAQQLNASFNILMPRKIAAPHNEELAIGAVMEDGTTYLNDDLVRILNISQQYIEQVKSEQIEEIKRRRSLYQNKTVNDSFSLTQDIIGKSKTVVLADDGAATGATLLAAARWIKGKNLPIQLIIATPIAPKEILTRLKKEVNHVEVIISPSTSSFKSVGQYYQSFEQVTDEQVIEIMRRRGSL